MNAEIRCKVCGKQKIVNGQKTIDRFKKEHLHPVKLPLGNLRGCDIKICDPDKVCSFAGDVPENLLLRATLKGMEWILRPSFNR